jgi:glycosyltransferase involved in cell wall biosynthesis
LEIVDGLYEGTDALIYSFSKLTPIVIQVHGSIRQHIEYSSEMPTIDRAKLRGLLFLSDTTARRADFVVALNPGAYEEMRRFVGVKQQKLRLVYHARDLTRYQNKVSDIRRKLGFSNSSPLVLFVGRLEERKGVHILCQAVPSILAVLPETKFLLLGMDTPSGPGGGSFKGFVSKQLQSQGAIGSTVFIDFLPDDELVQLYSASDLVVCPSLHEVASSVPLEAMACGKPVVATAVGLVPEIQLDGTNGEMVPPGDPGALAAAIVSVLRIVSAGDEQRRHIAERNRRIVERRTSVADWAGEMAAIYHDVSYNVMGNMSNNVRNRQ